ncbi:BlaI/MecI/CopY family transcriptional regulator [Marivirga sp. S37H4]|uniref:BlaI/MecI/CopY family transcriptional regulator n=1 Tax=Marivirga aurantiaca TaxID=2802615 RepID=A0A934WXP2_9BACT|nr:BlaI/MecI/CopY family transcriptional regulator [Marivirga aurantiaca]MBK6264816.1 BlaI/MecI/CopY family transcriptional regulator [Marivirga aurantiaca]
MQQLTRAEEEIMQKLWVLEKAHVKQVLELMPEPKPAYNTVSTIIRILEKKGVVGHEVTGKSHLYFPLLKKEEYKKQSLKQLIHGYFEGSFSKMASFFAKEEDLSTEEVDELLSHLKNNIKEKK